MRSATAFLSMSTFAVASTLLAGCSTEESLPTQASGAPARSITSEISEPCGDASVGALMAGQWMDAGLVNITNDGSQLCISYEAADGWALQETHVDVVLDPSEFPQTQAGNPKVGNFRWSHTMDGASADDFCVSLSEMGWVPGMVVYVAAHAVVKSSINGAKETAWADGDDFAGSSWATYMSHTVQDCGGEESNGGDGILQE